MIALLPKVGDIAEQPKPISLPTDGAVYNPELANCCSCEPEREAAIEIQLARQKAEAWKLCLDAEMLQLEVERRRLLLKKGEWRRSSRRRHLLRFRWGCSSNDGRSRADGRDVLRWPERAR